MKPFVGVAVMLAIALSSCAARDAEQAKLLRLAFPVTDFEPLQEGRGKVAHFTLTSRGELDGFLLEEGLEVRFPSQLSDRLGAVVRPGRLVSISGYRSPAAPVIIASEVMDAASERSVAVAQESNVAESPPAPLTGPPVPGARPATISGKVKRAIYRPLGGVEGAVLENGEVLRLSAQTSNRAELLLRPGEDVSAKGWRVRTPYGSVVAAETVTPAPAAQKPRGVARRSALVCRPRVLKMKVKPQRRLCGDAWSVAFSICSDQTQGCVDR